MPNSNGRIALLLVPLLFVNPEREGPGPDPAAILGWWHGSSTCTQAPWNSACHDETAVFEFVPTSPDSAESLLHAYKIVRDSLDLMGDLPIRFVRDSGLWAGDFANTRVSLRQTFRLSGDSLLGEIALRPDMRVARHQVLQRGWQGVHP